MKVLKATIENLGDHLAMRVETDEGTAWIENPKQRILSIGVVMSGPDVGSGKFPTETVRARSSIPTPT